MGINCLWIPSRSQRNPVSKLFFSRILAKEHVNPPSISVTLLLLGEIPAHGSTVSSCLRVLLGVSLRPSSGLLAEPTRSRMGKRPAFSFYRTQPCVQDCHSTEVANAPVHLSRQPSSF